MQQRLVDRIAENPFYVLGLERDCSRQDVEREGQKLLSMLTLGLEEAQAYTTPVGERPRTAELIRHAMSELREPRRRLVHELLAALPATSVVPVKRSGARLVLTWPEAPVVTGSGPRRTR